MVERVSTFERSIRLWVGWFIQSIEVVAMVRLVGKMRGSSYTFILPDWVTGGYDVIFSVAVVLGSALCWRFRDVRRYVGVVAILLILTSVTDNFATEIATQDAKLPLTRLEALYNSGPYLRIQSQRAAAQRDLDALVNRTALIPPEFTTQYDKNETNKAAIRKQIAEIDRQLEVLEQETLKVPGVIESAPTTEGVILGGSINGVVSVLMTIVVEALALSLTNVWKGDRITARPGRFAGFWVRHFRKVPKGIRADHLAYLQTALLLGKDHVLAGYRSVARHSGCTEREARRLMEECTRNGYLRGRRLRIYLPGPDSIPRRE